MPSCTIQIGSIAAGQTPGAILNPDSVVSWTPTVTAEVTTNPAEDGSQIADNITNQPRSGEAALMFSPSPSTPGLLPSPGPSRPEQAFQILTDAMTRKQAVFIVIDGHVYDPAAITSVRMPRQAPVDSRTLEIAWTEIKLVQARRASVRPVARLRRKGVKSKTVTQPTRADLAQSAATNILLGRWLSAVPQAIGAAL